MSTINIATDRARIRWQCRRGMLELDLLLIAFVDTAYNTLNAKERKIFTALLEYPDQLLYDYFFGDTKPVDKDVAHVIKQIRNSSAS